MCMFWNYKLNTLRSVINWQFSMDILFLGSHALTNYQYSAMIALLLLFLLLPSDLFSRISSLVLRRHVNEPWKLAPGPKILPIVGNLHQMSRLPHRSFRLLSMEHGPLMTVYLGLQRALVVSSAEFAEKIMKTGDVPFANRPELYVSKELSYGQKDVIFAPYGSHWRESRKLLLLELLSSKKVQSFQPVREAKLREALDVISRSGDGGVNLSELVLSMVINLVCRVSMGEEYVWGEHSQRRLQRMVKEMSYLTVAFSFSDNFPGLGWIDAITGLRTRVKKVTRDMDSLFDEIIEKNYTRQVHITDGDDGHDRSRDMIDRWLEMEQDQGGADQHPILSKEYIKGILMNVLTGGTDTSWAAIIWAMAELIRNPQIMAKAQREVRLVSAGKGRVVDEADMEKLQFLQSVVKETLRLHPLLPLVSRKDCREDHRIGGYDIPKGTLVCINAWSIMRDPNNYDDPEEFKPERFSGNDVDYKGKNFEFTPFGWGRRVCPGIHFGMATVNSILANLLCWFDWEMPHGMKAEEMDMSEAYGVTLHKKTDLILVARPARNSNGSIVMNPTVDQWH